MRIGLVETRRNGNRIIPALMVVAAGAAGTFGLLEFRPTADGRVDTPQAFGTAVPEYSGADSVTVAALEGRDQMTVRRLRRVGRYIPAQWRRKLVQRTAPALAKWIDGMNQRLNAAAVSRVPTALHDRLALSFKSHELTRARFVVDPDTITLARDAAYDFGRHYAITFGDIIVFRDADAARDEIEWARQLVHVRLYNRWGQERFATKYLENWRRIDGEARRVSARHAQALTAVYGLGDPGSGGAPNDGN